MRLIKYILRVHRVLGSILSALFFIWFVSGIVMIYHSFPKVTKEDVVNMQEKITLSSICLEKIDSLSTALFDSEKINSIIINSNFVYINREGKKESFDLSQKNSIVNLDSIAVRWSGSSDFTVKNISKLDQWIPFSHYKEKFPIRKYIFNDDYKTQIYIAEKTGDVLQLTTKESRFWSWIGAIPHWIYFYQLRQNRELWIWTVKLLSLLGFIMIICGVFFAIYIIKKRRGRGINLIPYKKRDYKLHFILGLIFGITTFTFTLSGFFSLAKAPKIFGKNEVAINYNFKDYIPFSFYKLDYKSLIQHYEDRGIVQIEWTNFKGEPYYIVSLSSGEKLYIDASKSIPRDLYLSLEIVESAMQKWNLENSYSIEVLNRYDGNYIDRRGKLELPVYKVVLNDPLGTQIYIAPSNAYTKVTTKQDRLQYFLYKKLHCLNFPFLVNNGLLWSVVMWFFMLGGTLLSVSGIVLTVRYIIRKID